MNTKCRFAPTSPGTHLTSWSYRQTEGWRHYPLPRRALWQQGLLWVSTECPCSQTADPLGRLGDETGAFGLFRSCMWSSECLE